MAYKYSKFLRSNLELTFLKTINIEA